jgi:photosystem II P680 reaction center D1 protein
MARFCEWVTSTENRLCRLVRCYHDPYTINSCISIHHCVAAPVDIDGIREPVSGSLLFGNNIISGAVVPTSNAIGLHFTHGKQLL